MKLREGFGGKSLQKRSALRNAGHLGKAVSALFPLSGDFMS